MPLAIRHPDAAATASGHLSGVGFALATQNLASATATVGLPPGNRRWGIRLDPNTIHSACRPIPGGAPNPNGARRGTCGAGRFKLI